MPQVLIARDRVSGMIPWQGGGRARRRARGFRSHCWRREGQRISAHAV